MEWTRRIALAALVASLAGSAAAVATADTSARGAQACITRFYVDSTEDAGADGDEPYLKVNTRFWSAPGSMDDGAQAAVNRRVHVGDRVRAYDDDWPDDDDLIGSDRLDAGLYGGTLVFESGDVRYLASWRRGAC